MEPTKAKYFVIPSGQSLARCSLEDHIKHSLRAVILTRKGERPLQPQLGCRVVDKLFRPLGTNLKTEIADEIREAVAYSEPRVSLLDVELSPSSTDRSWLVVNMTYQVNQTQKVDRMRLALQP